MSENTVNRSQQQTFVVNIDMDTGKYQDLVLRQLVRQIPGWFYTLTPTEIAEVLHSEAEHLTAIYPTERMKAVE